jgi:hypothetical protein
LSCFVFEIKWIYFLLRKRRNCQSK